MLFHEVTNLPDTLRLEVSTRINGIDGKLEIIKKGTQSLGLNSDVQSRIQVTLGEGGFGLLKQLRDAVIHARLVNAPMGVGAKIDRRASVYEVLLTAEALEALYEHITALRQELLDAGNLFIAARLANSAAGPEKASLEANKAVWSARFLEHQNRKQSLPPLPEFPAEQELIAARDAWFRDQKAAIMQWAVELGRPQFLARSAAQTELTEPPPQPPKKK